LAKLNGNILKIEDLHVSYGPVKALRSVSLEVKEGAIVTLIGANGAGKSTLLESVLAIHSPESGRIIFAGEDITHAPTENIVASGICLLPEGRGVVPLMTVLENLQLGGYYLNSTNLGKRLQYVYEHFPVLKERSSQKAGTLSGGEQQILSIARGLMSQPRLMMMDEPSLGLAPVMIEELFRIIVDLNREGYAILLSEQNARKALQVAQRAYVFELGEVILSGTSEEVASDPGVHKAYLGLA
jgi:branched-chain amino acid transport system ATP-binding protein